MSTNSTLAALNRWSTLVTTVCTAAWKRSMIFNGIYMYYVQAYWSEKIHTHTYTHAFLPIYVNDCSCTHVYNSYMIMLAYFMCIGNCVVNYWDAKFIFCTFLFFSQWQHQLSSGAVGLLWSSGSGSYVPRPSLLSQALLWS